LEPWNKKEEKDKPFQATCIRLLVETVYVLAHFFAPFIPIAAEAIAKKVGSPLMAIPDLKNNFLNLEAGQEVSSNSVLFQVFDISTGADDMAAKKKEKDDQKKQNKEAAPGKAKVKDEPLKPDDPNQPLFSKLEVRVGKIVKIWNHPKADRLFVEEIDVGEASGPRQIVSGLREHYKIEDLQDKKISVICNMAPAKLMGTTSSGMVLCAKSVDKKIVELLDVPDKCQVGDRVLPKGVPSKWQASAPNAVKEYKIWEAVAKELKSDGKKIACFEGKSLQTEKGLTFTAPTQASAEIS